MNSIPTLLILIWVCLRLPQGLLLPGKPLARILAATSSTPSQYVLEKGKEAGKSLAAGN